MPYPFDQLYLDMDGLLSDFHTGAIYEHLKAGHKFPTYGVLGQADPLQTAKLISAPVSWPKNVSLQKYMGITDKTHDNHKEYFWAPILREPMFTQRLLIYPWALELLDLCKGYSYQVIVCSHPSSNRPSEFYGKREWFNWHGIKLEEDKLELQLLRQKWQLSAPGRILIDDHERNVEQFAERINPRTGSPHGGKSILFPQPWNDNHSLAPRSDTQYRHTLDYIESQLKFLAGTASHLHTRHNVSLAS